VATYTTDPSATTLAAVRGGVLLLVPADAAGALTDVWASLAEPDPARAVLDRLTADGLSKTPSFALAVRADDSDEVRLVVRGGFTARVDLDVVDGAGVSTWAERILTGRTVILKATDAAAAGSQPTLPIVEGIVPAASVISTAVEPVSERVEHAVPAQVEPASVSAAPASAEVEPAEPLPAPPAPPAFTGPTHVDDATVVSVAGSSARTPSGPLAAQSDAAPSGSEQTMIPPVETMSGDHDGMTIVGADLQRLRGDRAARQGETGPDGGTESDQEVRALGIRMPDGTLEPIAHEVVLGRAPSASQLAGGRLPRVITIGGGDQDISRNHVRIAVEGDTVVITDLHSRNGTQAAQPGKAPVRLRAGEPTPVLTGTVVDLGGGWTIQVVAI